jgi:hypothetical protein
MQAVTRALIRKFNKKMLTMSFGDLMRKKEAKPPTVPTKKIQRRIWKDDPRTFARKKGTIKYG